MLVGLCAFGLAAHGRYSAIFADAGATITSNVAHIVGPLAHSNAGWHASGNLVDELGGTGMSAEVLKECGK